MTLAERLSEYVRAAFSGIWVRSFEHDDAVAEIAGLCRREGWSLAAWDVDRGLSLAGEPAGAGRPGRRGRPARRGPLPRAPWRRPTARRCWCSGTSTGSWAAPRSSRPSTPRSPAASGTAPSSSSSRPVVQIPVELEKQFVVLEHDLPGRDQLEAIARGVATEPGELPDGRRPGRRARRVGGADPGGGRERLQPVAGAPRPARPRGPLGASSRGR